MASEPALLYYVSIIIFLIQLWTGYTIFYESNKTLKPHVLAFTTAVLFSVQGSKI